jgi:N,N'-diacetyllegionaminate synthase
MREGVFIIAEAGVNHDGRLEQARKLVDAAARAGADAVKFQTFRAETLVSPSAPKAEYQRQATGADESQYDMLRRLELPAAAHRELIAHCRRAGIRFLSSPFDLASIDLLLELGLDIFKIPSGEITNLPYLRRIGGLGKEVILSTGMAEMSEIEAALRVLADAGTPKERVTVLHCNTEYPTPMADVNLRAMASIGQAFGVRVGYSDHTLGIEVPIAAAALGARVIEKHFTLDRTLPGPDHRASLEPEGLQAMVAAVRNIEKALGRGIKRPSASEFKNRSVARKSIYAACSIHAGELLTEENLTIKRPGTGLSPMLWDKVVGQKASRDFSFDEAISLE